MFFQKKRKIIGENDKILKKPKLFAAINKIGTNNYLNYDSDQSCRLNMSNLFIENLNDKDINHDNDHNNDKDINHDNHDNHDNDDNDNNNDEDINHDNAHNNDEDINHGNDHVDDEGDRTDDDFDNDNDNDNDNDFDNDNYSNDNDDNGNVRDDENENYDSGHDNYTNEGSTSHVIYRQRIRSDSSPEEIFTRIVSLVGNIIQKATTSSSINKDILDFLDQKVNMIQLKKSKAECHVCREEKKIVKTKCCNFELCKICFIKWIYENSSSKLCKYTCPQCRCSTHKSIDSRFYSFMKKLC